LGDGNAYKILVGKSGSKMPLMRSKRRRKDNSVTDWKEVECDYVDWFHLAQYMI